MKHVWIGNTTTTTTTTRTSAISFIVCERKKKEGKERRKNGVISMVFRLMKYWLQPVCSIKARESCLDHRERVTDCENRVSAGKSPTNVARVSMACRNVVEHAGHAIGKARIFINFFEHRAFRTNLDARICTLAPLRQISLKREFFFALSSELMFAANKENKRKFLRKSARVSVYWIFVSSIIKYAEE